MAFKFNILSLAALLAVANAGFIGSPLVVSYAAQPSVDAVASTHQNVVRSFGGTVSHHSKAIDTPYSSVRKEDTRITNNVYTPAIANTVTYAAPVVAKTLTYAAAPVATYSAHAPAVYSHVAPAPAVYSHVASAPAVYAAAPAVVKHTAIAYSPAVSVAHVTFDGFGTHWGY